MHLLPETQLSLSAKQAKKTFNWFITFLISILVFVVGTMAEFGYYFPLLNTGFLLRLGSFPKTGFLYQILNPILSHPDTVTLLELFSTAGLITVPIFYCVVLEQRPIESLGFCGPGAWKEYLIGLLIGTGMFSAALLICIVTGAVTVSFSTSFSPLILCLYFVAFLIQGMSEEVFCRGFLMQSLSVRYHPLVAILLNSLIFMALHLANDSISLLALLNLFLFGVFASVCMWKRGSIWGVAAIHSAWNFAQGNLYGIRVSGARLGPSVLTSELKGSASLINGGAFGLEGGLAVTVILAVGILIMLLSPVRNANRIK